MKKEATDQLTDRELKRAVSRAFKRVEKMLREGTIFPISGRASTGSMRSTCRIRRLRKTSFKTMTCYLITNRRY